MIEQDAYAYQAQLVLNALASAGSPLQKIQLTSLTHRNDPSLGASQWNSLTTLLSKLVGHAPALRLFRSDLALALLSRTNLSLRDLVLCSIYTRRAFPESFLKNSIDSLRSLKFDDIAIGDRGRRDYSYHLDGRP
jgi:hypothetical protein